MSVDFSALTTTVRNTSGRTVNFCFLPPHGVELAADEEVSIFGHIADAVYRGDRFGGRHALGLMNALENDLIEIVSTPAPILEDVSLGTRHQMVLNNGTLAISNPSWETSLSA